MKYIKTLLYFAFFYIAPTINGQDVHFTNYRTVSNFFNVAQTGDFLGSYKFQMGVRTQYQNVYGHGVAGAEINISSPFNNSHWIGAGINMLYDKSGTLNLTTIGVSPNIAYHIPLDKNSKSVISIGMGMDRFSMTANTDKYRSELTIMGLQDPDQKFIDDFNDNLISLNNGIHFKSQLNKKNQISLGIAFAHWNAPKFAAINKSDPASIGSRVNFQTAWKTQVSKTITIEPAIYLSFSERQTNTNFQLMSEWKIVPRSKWKGILGISHRYQESYDFTVGYKTEKLYLHCSFDILTSQASYLITNPGALELGAYYIVYKNYKPVIKPIIFCPRL